MKNEKEFYKKLDEVARKLLNIEPIKKRAENVFFIFDKERVAFAVGDQKGNKETMSDEIKPFVDIVSELLASVMEVYTNLREDDDEIIKIPLKNYLKSKITIEEIREFFYKNNLVILMDRFEDKDFCLEVLNAKFPDNHTDEIINIFNYFNE